MYKFFAFLFVIAIAEGCHIPCHWHDPKPLVNYFDALAKKVIELDRLQSDHCRENNVPDIKYLHGEDAFQMIIPAPGFCENDISVKYGRRLLFIEACSCDEEVKFSDLRFIPDFLALSCGNWIYENDEIIITIPYASGSLDSPHLLDYNNRNLQTGIMVMRKGG